jgi:hypothetical protein
MKDGTLIHGNSVLGAASFLAIDGGTASLIVAENISPGGPKIGTTQRARRKSLIDDPCLWGDRDSLLFLLEVTWADVGGKLHAVKTADDVLAALQIWNERSDNSPVVKTLLRPASTAASAKTLTEKRRRLRELIKLSREARERLEKCRQDLELADRALSLQLSERDKAAVEERRARRAEKFDRAEAEHNVAASREAKIEQQLREFETYFARTEFARFCKSKRYRLTPLNAANAIAGLPLMGWRQSVQRCMKSEAVGANGGAIQVFNTIKRIIDSCTRKSQLAKHAERWLKTQKAAKSLGVSELRKEFYYLQSAIKTVLETKPQPRRRELPYAIAREYREHKNHASDVDKLFAEDEAL